MAVAGLVSALGLCLLSGCGGDSGDQLTAANRGDCVASVRFRGVVHITNTHVDQTAPKGRAIGPGALLDCDHRTVVDRVVVSAVRGADTRRAVSVRGDWHGVYVAEGPPSVQ
jgi:hypothetical protein